MTSLFPGLFEAVPDALVVVDERGHIVQANHHAERLFGYPPQGLTDISIEQLIPEDARIRHHAHRAGYMAKPHVRPMGGTGQTLVGQRHDGTQFPVEIALSPIESTDGPRYLASIRDISETQRARQALIRARHDALAAHIGQLALESDDEAHVLDQVPSLLAETLGIEIVAIAFVQSEGHAMEIRSSVGLKEDPAAFLAALHHDGDGLSQVITTAHPVTVRDFHPGDSTAAEAANDGVLMPLLDRNRATGALIALSRKPQWLDHDALHLLQSVANLIATLVQRRRMEEQLAHSQRMDAIGQLTGGIAHDFNNLLTVMSGSLQLLEDVCGDNTEAGELIASALRSVTRGAELTNKLLAFGRRQRLLPQALDVASLLRDVERMLKRTLGDAVRLRAHCANDLPAAYVDATQLDTALVNLALNARDAMPRGGEIDIEAQAWVVPDDQAAVELAAGRYVLISVNDTGRGMAPETLARAMEPFFTTKDVGRGSGLGLSMVYGFAKQSGGHLRIQSALGYGTRVELYLPVAKGGPAVPLPTSTTETPSRGETILVVEDDIAVRDIAVAFLRAAGYHVHAATHATEALRQLKDDPQIALMFSDVLLGDGPNGKELARTARRLRPGLAILLTSGYEDSAASGAAESEVFDLLRKPYQREQLLASVQRALSL